MSIASDTPRPLVLPMWAQSGVLAVTLVATLGYVCGYGAAAVFLNELNLSATPMAVYTPVHLLTSGLVYLLAGCVPPVLLLGLTMSTWKLVKMVLDRRTRHNALVYSLLAVIGVVVLLWDRGVTLLFDVARAVPQGIFGGMVISLLVIVVGTGVLVDVKVPMRASSLRTMVSETLPITSRLGATILAMMAALVVLSRAHSGIGWDLVPSWQGGWATASGMVMLLALSVLSATVTLRPWSRTLWLIALASVVVWLPLGVSHMAETNASDFTKGRPQATGLLGTGIHGRILTTEPITGESREAAWITGIGKAYEVSGALLSQHDGVYYFVPGLGTDELVTADGWPERGLRLVPAQMVVTFMANPMRGD